MAVRAFLGSVLAAALLALLGSAAADEAPRMHRIGVLDWSPSLGRAAIHDAFVQALRELGYEPGRNITIEHVFANQSRERAAALAAELVGRPVDVIVTRATPAGHAAAEATDRIPIVLATAADPVGTGLVANLARPGGNVTGISLMMPDLAAKRLEIMREIFPKATRFAFLGSARDPATPRFLEQLQAAARDSPVTITPFLVSDPTDLEAAIRAIGAARADAVIVQPLFVSEAPAIARAAIEHRLPTISDLPLAARAGYLLTYGPSNLEPQRRAAVLVDKILRGAKAGDLPIEQPTSFELVVNLQTARALGVTVPAVVLARADEVIE